MYGQCVLSDHGLLFSIHQEQHMWPTSILLQFWLSNEKKNAEYHRYAYSDSLARAFEILWTDQRDRCLRSKKHSDRAR